MSDDLIKRNIVIATIGRMYEVCTTRDITDYRDLMLEAVKVLPSADRPQGEWICTERMGTFKLYDCSVCGIHIEAPWNFCPNCGARMKGADDDSKRD